MKTNGSGTGGSYLVTSSVQTVFGNLSVPMLRRGRAIKDPIWQLDAGSFISLTHQIKKTKGKGKRRCLGWGCG